MRRFAFRGFFLCVLALWIQLLAPVAAMSDESADDPFFRICSHASADHGTPAQDDHAHRHEHCLLCQAAFSGPPLDERTPTVAPVRPQLSQSAWRPNLSRAPPTRTPPRPPSRGPPAFL